ncbi:lysylphosphatidylglycerol synthase domain-containing protein [Salmonirosea aquatica]|uniref:lysylphosphatidylglycerol synthase domain-containing protein n=1 Tax=Salmonirosea aquatica TaxID=2654236 RepID=UPI00357116E8
MAKWIVTLLILSYIYATFQKEQKGVRDIGVVLHSIFILPNRFVLGILFFLVPINWMLESLKWKFLAQKAVSLDFREAFRSTLAGLAVGVAVPAQLGDTLGRITSLRSDKRLKTLGAALVSNGIQFYISVLGGTLGWLLASTLPFSPPYDVMMEFLLVLIVLGGIGVGIFRRKITGWPAKRQWAIKFKENIQVINLYTGRDLTLALGLGALRYAVFVAQFALALSLFDLPIPFLNLIRCVSLILLAKTLLPAINVLGDLGLREFTALLVFEPYGLASEKIIAATFLIWLINILGPLLVGVFLIWKHQWNARYE